MPRLVIDRKLGECVRLYGPAIVTIHKIAGNRVKLLFEAEQDVTILRGEILNAEPKALDSKQSARRKRGTPES